MRCTIPEISWHNRDPVLSVDIGPNIPKSEAEIAASYRLATGGTDTHVLIWKVQLKENGAVHVDIVADLTRHNRAVNVVRFNKSGDILASGDDEANILLWKQQEVSNAPDIFGDNNVENKENWVILRALRGHIEDVYDLAWSHDSSYLISGSIDNTAIIWDAQTGRNLGILSDQRGFVQGVAIDPSAQLIATMSSDRTLRIYDFNSKKVLHRIHKFNLPLHDCKCSEMSEGNTEGKPVHQHSIKLFHDDTFKSFFRRISFSPDGEILVVPSGLIEYNSVFHTNASYLFSRSNLSKPAVYLPTGDKFTLAAKFCPKLFELNPILNEDMKEADDWTKYSNMFHLPYRMIFAIAIQDSVLLYDTQQPIPFAEISNIHYGRLSDLSWSPDGRVLMISSTDGYCSFVSFDQGELGTEYHKANLIPEKKEMESKSFQVMNEEKTRESIIPDKSDSCLPSLDVDMEEIKIPPLILEEESIQECNVNESAPIKPQVPSTEQTTSKNPRRIQLITLSSPKSRGNN